MARRTIKSRALVKLLLLIQNNVPFDEAVKITVSVIGGEYQHYGYHPQVTERWVLKLWNDLRNCIKD